LFIGVDLAMLNPSADGAEARQLMNFGVLGAALLFALWGWAAVRQVPLQRLIDTTIAPVLVAKQAWGQWGRLTMGTVTIAGTLAAVNALFSVVAATTQEILRKFGGNDARLPRATMALLLGLATAAAMALGLAGTEGIDVSLRAGLVLWLLHYALAQLPAREGGTQPQPRRRPLALLSGGILVGGAGLLLLTDSHRAFLLTSMLVGLSSAVLLTGGLWGWANLKTKTRSSK
jgi:hypothetical protein